MGRFSSNSCGFIGDVSSVEDQPTVRGARLVAITIDRELFIFIF